jgi:serine/threonine-protein kinase
MTPEQWARVQDLFHGALEHPVEAREAWLDAQTDDPAIRTDVRALLRADAGAGDQLISDVIAEAANTLHEAVRRAPAVGTRVGPYRLLEEIGHGGMGTVYLAERADDEYRARVAIKFVRGHLATPDLARRLLAERQILADLTHPNIAWLLDGGTTDDGTPYLVMEYIDGEPIDAWCDRAQLGLSGRIALFRAVCEAVRYAHAGLVVHRDVKPSNILVARDGTPKLVDFGIAKLLAGEGAPDATGTLRMLTPAYAAPEQVRGERITVATDVYALGGVLYRLLTGSPPHETAGVGSAEVERRIAEVDPPPASVAARAAGQPWHRRLEGDLDTIIQTALQKEPARRYASVERLVDDLRRHAEGRPVAARPDTMGYRVGKFVRRNRSALIVGAVAFLVAAGFLAWHGMRITTERNLARAEAARAREVTTFLRELFEVADPSASRGETITARELLDAGATRIESDLASQPDVQATLMRTIGEVYASIGLSEVAGPLIARAHAQHQEILGDDDLETSISRLSHAAWLQDAGDLDAARPLFEAVLRTRQRQLPASDPMVGVAHHQLAYLLEAQGDFEGAERHFRAALASARDETPSDPRRVADAATRLGRLLRQLDRFAEAETLLREGLAGQRRVLGDLHPDVAGAARNLAALLRDLGQYEAADTLFREAIATRRRIFGEAHSEVATTLNSYASMLDDWGKPDSAIAVARAALAILELPVNAGSPNLPATIHNLGVMEHKLGRLDEAIILFTRALVVQEKMSAPGHHTTAFPRVSLANVLLDQQRPELAEPLLREAVAIRRAALPAGHRYTAQAMGDLGRALLAQGKRADGIRLMDEAYQMLRDGLGEDDSRTVSAKQRLEAAKATEGG